MSSFYWELHCLYLNIIKTSATPNAWYRQDVFFYIKSTHPQKLNNYW